MNAKLQVLVVPFPPAGLFGDCDVPLFASLFLPGLLPAFMDCFALMGVVFSFESASADAESSTGDIDKLSTGYHRVILNVNIRSTVSVVGV